MGENYSQTLFMRGSLNMLTNLITDTSMSITPLNNKSVAISNNPKPSNILSYNLISFLNLETIIKLNYN